MSKLNLLNCINSSDPLPLTLGVPLPRADALQKFADKQAAVELQKAAELAHFESINYTPDLHKITGKKRLPIAPAGSMRAAAKIRPVAMPAESAEHLQHVEALLLQAAKHWTPITPPLEVSTNNWGVQHTIDDLLLDVVDVLAPAAAPKR